MSRALFSRNPDLKRLRDEGYFVLQQGGHLVMREVPYVDAHREVRIGTLISSLTLAGDRDANARHSCRPLGRRLPVPRRWRAHPGDLACSPAPSISATA